MVGDFYIYIFFILVSFVVTNFLPVFCVQGCVALEELYLSHNGILKMEGLSSLVNLRVLDVSSNKLTSVNDVLNLTQYVYSSISLLRIICFSLCCKFHCLI